MIGDFLLASVVFLVFCILIVNCITLGVVASINEDAKDNPWIEKNPESLYDEDIDLIPYDELKLADLDMTIEVDANANK